MADRCEGCLAIEYCDAQIAVDTQSVSSWDERAANLEEHELDATGSRIIATENFGQGLIDADRLEIVEKLTGEVLASTQDPARAARIQEARQAAAERVTEDETIKAEILSTCSPAAARRASVARQLGRTTACGSESAYATVYVGYMEAGIRPFGSSK